MSVVQGDMCTIRACVVGDGSNTLLIGMTWAVFALMPVIGSHWSDSELSGCYSSYPTWSRIEIGVVVT